MTTTARDYVVCAGCERLRLRPPTGLGGTNDVACEVCHEAYSVLDAEVTADALANELHTERRLTAALKSQEVRPWEPSMQTLQALPLLETRKGTAKVQTIRLIPEELAMLEKLAAQFLLQGGQRYYESMKPKPTSKNDIVRWLIREAFECIPP